MPSKKSKAESPVILTPNESEAAEPATAPEAAAAPDDSAAAVWFPLADLVPWGQNPRNNDDAVPQVVKSIKRFGFGAPVVARLEDKTIIAGHTRVRAAKAIGLEKVPVRFLDVTKDEAKALALADNKLGEIATWDDEALKEIVKNLAEADATLIDDAGFDDVLKGMSGGDDEREIHPPDVDGVIPGPCEYAVMQGDCRASMATLPDQSVDCVVCDPPYELGFDMGKGWDSTGIAYDVEVWKQAFRVLKPGGHLIAFGGTRTYHRMAVAIEDAGFEIRDCIQWLYGSGFPKSLDVSKALDKAAGAEREVVGSKVAGLHHGSGTTVGKFAASADNFTADGRIKVTAPATELAKQWDGWGTALKPANEPAILARKPLEGTVAENVTKWGVGALNIEGCRVPYASAEDYEQLKKGVDALKAKGGVGLGGNGSTFNASDLSGANDASEAGRWPANVIFDPAAAAALDAQMKVEPGEVSRFFYVAKPDRGERDAGCEDLPDAVAGVAAGPAGFVAKTVRDAGGAPHTAGVQIAKNDHATVKPVTLMRHLIRLVNPRGGKVLDPFCGSGTTGCAAMVEGARFVGCELDPHHVDIAKARIEWWKKQAQAATSGAPAEKVKKPKGGA